MLSLTRRPRESIRIGVAILTCQSIDARRGCVTLRIYGTPRSLGRSITLWLPELVQPGNRLSAREFLPEVADEVEVALRRIQGGQCSLGIQAPPQIKILRTELEERVPA